MLIQRRSRSRGAALLACAALALAGCGDDTGSEDGGDDSGGDAAAADVAVSAVEFAFTPAAWSAPAGAAFTVQFTNDGSTEHEWAVIKLGEDISSGDEFAEDKVLLEVEAIPAGESTTEEITIDEAGTYQVICALDDHFDQGMEGTLTVG